MGACDYAGWQQGPLSGVPDGAIDAVRHATQTGEPLGSREFLKQLEWQAARRLRVWGGGGPRTGRGRWIKPACSPAYLRTTPAEA